MDKVCCSIGSEVEYLIKKSLLCFKSSSKSNVGLTIYNEWSSTGSHYGPVAILLVEDSKKSESSRARPVPLNTVKMLQEASKVLGMGPFTAMQNAERLYLQGYISYPRTESSSYPDSYDIRGALSQQKNDIVSHQSKLRCR